MGRRRRSEGARARAMGRFVEGGALVVTAAAKAGVHASTLYRWRREVAGFAEAWDAAAAKSAGPMLIAARNQRALQKRRSRRLRFTAERKEEFLAQFARTCDAKAAAAAAAGVCESTVHKHLRSDAAFAEGWQEALEIGHQLLRAELVAKQMAARASYKAVRVAERAPADAKAAGTNFERGLKLLDSWQRREDGLARRAARTGDPRTGS